MLALLAFTQALTGLVEASSAFALFRRHAARPSPRAVTVLFVTANAALCVIVAWADPMQVVYAVGAVLALSAVYPLIRKMTGKIPTAP